MNTINLKICGTCKWCRQDDFFNDDWICVNADSEYCTDYTDYTNTCEEWEQRGIE